jgi:hypothetical protein
MLFNETLRNQVRQFNSSAEARDAGFCTRDWLRAFTFAEHCVRIDRERAARDALWAGVE